MTKWIILLVFVGVAWIAWKRMPIGRIHGRKVTPSDLIDPNVRLQLQLSRARTALEECISLPPRDRLPKLLDVEKRFGSMFLGGDEIRQAIVATGVSEAVPHFGRILNERHGPGSVIHGISDALAGTV